MFTTLKHKRNVFFSQFSVTFCHCAFLDRGKFATVCRTSRILETAMGTTTMKTKCCVFRLPKDGSDKQTSLNVLPQRNSFQINPAKFFICERPKHSPRVVVVD